MGSDSEQTRVATRRGQPRADESAGSRTGSSDSSVSGTAGTTGGTAGPTGTSAGTGTTAPIVLRDEERARTKALARLAALVAVVALFAVWAPTEVHPGRMLATITIALTGTFALALNLRLRRSEAALPDGRVTLAFGLSCVATILAVIYYVGVFSPAPMALCVGVYFFGLSDSKRHAWVIFGASTLGYAGLWAAAASGVIPLDRSVLALRGPALESVVATGLLELVLIATTFWMARRSRHATLTAFARLDRAIAQIKQRDALLNEARADLSRAAGARLGRYTGERIGEFLLDEVIGRGAMGEVYRATHAGSEREAAVKMLHPFLVTDPGQRERFQREVEVSARLRSPHIVAVLDHGTAPDGAPYLAMELLEGDDLAHELRDKKRLGMRTAVEMVKQLAKALEVSERAGVVHRDLKPQNVFCVRRGRSRHWKVLDFGVSKLRESEGTLTGGAAVGTPSYMSPEQARGIDVDARADQFALGIIAYRALTGRPAFTGDDAVATLYNVVHVQPVRPSSVVRLPRTVDSVLAIALAKNPDDRFASSGDLADALERAARGELDDAVDRKARALLARQPWGTAVNDDDREAS